AAWNRWQSAPPAGPGRKWLASVYPAPDSRPCRDDVQRETAADHHRFWFADRHWRGTHPASRARLRRRRSRIPLAVVGSPRSSWCWPLTAQRLAELLATGAGTAALARDFFEKLPQLDHVTQTLINQLAAGLRIIAYRRQGLIE